MKKLKTDMTEEKPEDIVPKDDAFHGSLKRRAAEWWYFDAIFDNGYSTHIGCMTFSKKNKGTATKVLEIYKDGKLLFEKREKFKFKDFESSKDKPLVKISDENFIEFNQEKYNKSGKWSYDVSIKIEDYALNLTFIGNTKGWKIQTEEESWTVALPKANVTGEMTINGKKTSVKGIGYHDHNWNYSLKTLLSYGKGWYWGRVTSGKNSVIFAKIIKSHNKSTLLSIINQDDKGYINISPKSIGFQVSKFTRIHNKKIPTEFTFTIDEVPIKIDVVMNTKETHYQRRLLILSYFRFHTKSKGFISVNGKKEKVNETQILELMKFR